MEHSKPECPSFPCRGAWPCDSFDFGSRRGYRGDFRQDRRVYCAQPFGGTGACGCDCSDSRRRQSRRGCEFPRHWHSGLGILVNPWKPQLEPRGRPEWRWGSKLCRPGHCRRMFSPDFQKPVLGPSPLLLFTGLAGLTIGDLTSREG